MTFNRAALGLLTVSMRLAASRSRRRTQPRPEAGGLLQPSEDSDDASEEQRGECCEEPKRAAERFGAT